MKLCAMSYECNESIATRREKESSLNREVDNHNTCPHTQTNRYPQILGTILWTTYTQDKIMQQYRRLVKTLQ